MLRDVLAFCVLACANALVVPARAGAITMASPGGKPKPLSPGSNYPTTKNIQKQSYGFGSFLQKFQVAKGKSKYGMPIYLPNGNINPAYLAAERAEMAKAKVNNRKTLTSRRKQMESKGTFLLDSYIEKKIGNVGSGKAYYQSGSLSLAVEQLESGAQNSQLPDLDVELELDPGSSVTTWSITGVCCTSTHSPATPSHSLRPSLADGCS